MSDVTLLNPLPKVFTLRQNFPNPFKGKTTIQYQLPEDSQVILKIYNLAGQQVKTLIDETQSAGYYKIDWDGKDSNGNMISSGIYFYRFIAQDPNGRNQRFLATRKIIFLK